jgi:hypothetical protein
MYVRILLIAEDVKIHHIIELISLVQTELKIMRLN